MHNSITFKSLVVGNRVMLSWAYDFVLPDCVVPYFYPIYLCDNLQLLLLYHNFFLDKEAKFYLLEICCTGYIKGFGDLDICN